MSTLFRTTGPAAADGRDAFDFLVGRWSVGTAACGTG